MFSIKKLLFLLTILSTLHVGRLYSLSWVEGILYCASIMGILLVHELGHYFMCRRHGVDATLPVFLPMPLPPFGTMGAVIRIRSPIPHRQALFDIGIAGPLAGIALAIPLVAIGLDYSTISRGPSHGDAMIFGEPLLLKFLIWQKFGPRPADCDVLVHPMVIAAWAGIFVTALNLLPFGQLDGGHVVYAAFGRGSRYLFAGVVGLVVTLCVTKVLESNYVIFLALMLLLGPRHPPTIYDDLPLGWKRRALSLLALFVFVLCFTPHPLRMVSRP